MRVRGIGCLGTYASTPLTSRGTEMQSLHQRDVMSSNPNSDAAVHARSLESRIGHTFRDRWHVSLSLNHSDTCQSRASLSTCMQEKVDGAPSEACHVSRKNRVFALVAGVRYVRAGRWIMQIGGDNWGGLR